MKLKLIVITGFLMVNVLAVAAGSRAAIAAEASTLSFGIVPQQTASTLLQSWGPLLQWLSRRTGYDIEFKTAPDIPTFESRLQQGEYDFAYMNPYHFTVFNRVAGYRAVARASNKRIHGIIVVHRDSNVVGLDDLDGQQIAFPAPAAFAATVLPRANLAVRGVRVEPRYVSSHDSVYRAVAGRFYPAGGGVVRTLRSAAPEIRDQLRVLWKSPGYTPHAIAVHSRVPDHQIDALRQALTEVHRSEDGRVVLERLKISGFQEASNDDWDDVRALEIDALMGMAD